MTDERPRRPTLAELRAVAQPSSITGRRASEHWTGDLYMRRLSIHLTRALVATPISANGVTGLMICCGWLAAASLLIPGLLGPLLAAVFAQLQMFFDCADGEVARWRGVSSPAGVFLDKVGHYTAEGFIGLALGLRASGMVGQGQHDPADTWRLAFVGALLMAGIVLNKALNDMVHVARAFAGLGRLADSAEATAVPSGSLVGRLRRLARFVPFHRLFHSIELTLLALAVGVVGALTGHDLLAFRLLVVLLAAAIGVVLVGHFVAILASPRLRRASDG